MRMSTTFKSGVIVAAVLGCAASAQAVIYTLSPLSSFGNNGWRAPSVVLPGDSAGSAISGSYRFLQSASNERGLSYNPVTGNLALVSRNGGINVRILNGLTGADIRGLTTTGVTGGTFAASTVGVAGDGAIYAANLTTNISSSALKVYRWDDENSAVAPTASFNATIASFSGTPRFGDSLDITGSGTSTRIALGASGSTGYVVLTGSTSQTAQSITAFSVASPTGPGSGDFRLGITFAGGNAIWGKQTGASAAVAPLRRSTYNASGPATFNGSSTLTVGGEMVMDYAEIAGVPYLATVDSNASVIRVYDVSTPGTPILRASGTTTSGTLISNGNGVGAVAFGPIDQINGVATIYAMSTNQGIQAMVFAIPEPAALGALAPVLPLLARRRRA